MNSLKTAVKNILISRQHKLYKKEVEARNLTYDRWIREQEEGLEIAPIILNDNEKCLTNDFLKDANESLGFKNEGKHAKTAEIFHFMNKNGFQTPKDDESAILWVDAETFSQNYNTIIEAGSAEIILISFYRGEISEIALPVICDRFEKNKNIILIYGDEDTLEGAERTNPWFKPDWSPDTFLSSFYFGGLVAVRTESLKKIYRGQASENGDDGDKNVLKEAGSKAVSSREQVYRLLYELIKANDGFVMGHDCENHPVHHIRQVLFHTVNNGYEEIKDMQLEIKKDGQKKENPHLSIIIPSKDNPKVLFQCIESLINRTKTRYSYDILVIDNGSNEENKAEIEKEMILRSSDRPEMLQYVYNPMPFNFSKMCNLGAGTAKGDIFLFLNDDMEIIQPDWLDLLMEKALQPYVGAVGAKLFYPDTDIIQHAGITNLRVGPAHKLQFLSDSKEYYFGKNRGVHNMLAVTGACLMVRKEVFERAKGFAEELAVAFNDVDLCYTIHEMGYYNVQRNDVVLYHHESLSRGKDGESTEKQLRLQREKDVLYERHQDIYGKDPFYHPNLTMDMLESAYSPAFHYQVKLDMPWSQAYDCTEQVKKAREDQCLVVGMECAMDLYKWQYGVSPQKGKVQMKPEDMGYYFQGYSFVIGADNACYKKKLLLKNQETSEVLAIPMESRYRQDIKRNLKDQLNVDLTGYAAKLQREKLDEGIYQFGMLAEDTCSRQRLVNWSNWVLEVK